MKIKIPHAAIPHIRVTQLHYLKYLEEERKSIVAADDMGDTARLMATLGVEANIKIVKLLLVALDKTGK